MNLNLSLGKAFLPVYYREGEGSMVEKRKKIAVCHLVNSWYLYAVENRLAQMSLYKAVNGRTSLDHRKGKKGSRFPNRGLSSS